MKIFLCAFNVKNKLLCNLNRVRGKNMINGCGSFFSCHFTVIYSKKWKILTGECLLSNKFSKRHWTSIAFKYNKWYRRSRPLLVGSSRLLLLLGLEFSPSFSREPLVEDELCDLFCSFSDARILAATARACDTISRCNSWKKKKNLKEKIRLCDSFECVRWWEFVSFSQ